MSEPRRPQLQRVKPLVLSLLALGLGVVAFGQTKTPAPADPIPTNMAAAGLPTTEPMLRLSHNRAKAAFSLALWVHPESPLLSAVIVSDRAANLLTMYDLRGNVLDRKTIPGPGQVDVRYGFPLGGQKIDIVAVNQRRKGPRLRLFKVVPDKYKLLDIREDKMYTGNTRGCCLYKSPKTNKFYVFLNTRKAEIRQHELIPGENGKVQYNKTPASTHRVLGPCGFMLADDAYRRVLIVEPRRCVWLYGAEPDDTTKGRPVIFPTKENDLRREIQGLALIHGPDGRGAITVSSQGSDRFCVYRRHDYRHAGSFRVGGAERGQSVLVSGLDFGGNFAGGIVACNTRKEEERELVLVAPLKPIVKAFQGRLTPTPDWDPRVPEVVKPILPDKTSGRRSRKSSNRPR